MTIALPIEIKVREYLSKAFLAYKIVENSDQNVVIGEKNKVHSLFKKNENIFLLSKGGPAKLFKFYNNNRNINKTHVKYLKNSIAEHGQFASICVRKVGKYYFISDGQHRFMACVELDIPVKYIEDDIYTQDSVLHMNTKQSNWRTEDYVHRYAMEGDTTYISLEQMYAFYNFTTSKINDAFCAKNVTNTSKIIKNRTYQININQGKKVLNLATDLFKHTKDGIFLHTNFRILLTLLHSKLSSIFFDPGFVDSPPISTKFAPELNK